MLPDQNIYPLPVQLYSTQLHITPCKSIPTALPGNYWWGSYRVCVARACLSWGAYSPCRQDIRKEHDMAQLSCEHEGLRKTPCLLFTDLLELTPSFSQTYRAYARLPASFSQTSSSSLPPLHGPTGLTKDSLPPLHRPPWAHSLLFTDLLTPPPFFPSAFYVKIREANSIGLKEADATLTWKNDIE